ncbi:MAG: hypoxanthine phosphoribosyltransferase [Tissierellales bacterium]|jgi:hypoxanthine phosphoribosyltransferase|nr:hypoxanthine phosphoribosyltransferase [Tissierellales bacterium]
MMNEWMNDIERVLLTEEDLKNKIAQLGEQISKDYQGEELLLLGILKGSVIFMSDLARSISIPVSMDFMAVSSYGDGTESSGVVRILKDLDQEIKGKNILIVEDIIDSGLTLDYLMGYFKARGPKSVEICTIMDKSDRRTVEVPIKYLGFDVPNEFLVGYGLDYAEKYRNLPFVGILKEEVYK